MKAILMSIKPQHVANILNGLKTIEIRRRFPSDYVGWVYIYCTKAKPYITGIYNYEHKIVYGDIENKNHNINGKVVARFWCDRVDEFYDFDDDLCEQACLDRGEMLDYLGDKKGYAIHITKLEIFDKPKEIREFKTHLGCNKTINCMLCKYNVFNECTRPRYLTRAPRNYCYIEI